MQNLHKDNALWTIIGMFYPAAAAATRGLAGDAGGGTDTGVLVYVNATDKLAFNLRNGVSDAVIYASTAAFTEDFWQFFGLAVDEAAGAAGSRANIDGTEETFDATYTSPSAGSATDTLEIAATGNAVSPLINGSRLACLAMWSTDLSAAQIESVRIEINKRFGL